MGVTSTETVTRTEIIDLALRQLGNTNPSSNDRANGVLVLNALLKAIDPLADWSWTWQLTPGTITTVAAQRAYDVATDGLAANIFRVEHVERVTGTNLNPIIVIDTPEALISIDREGTGQPIWAYLEREPILANQRLHLLPTADAVYTFQYTYRRRLYDFTSSTDNPDFPGEWNYTLGIILASKMSREYGMPMADRQELNQEAGQLLTAMVTSNTNSDYIPTLKTLYY